MSVIGGENSFFPPGLPLAHTVTLSDVALWHLLGEVCTCGYPVPEADLFTNQKEQPRQT